MALFKRGIIWGGSAMVLLSLWSQPSAATFLPPPAKVTGEKSRFLSWSPPAIVVGLGTQLTRARFARATCEQKTAECQQARLDCAAISNVGPACVPPLPTCWVAAFECFKLQNALAAPGYLPGADPLQLVLLGPSGQAILGVNPFKDTFRFDSYAKTASAEQFTYQHYLRVPLGSTIPGPEVPVHGSRIVFQVHPLTGALIGVSSHFESGHTLPSSVSVITATAAIQRAAQFFSEAELPPPAQLPSASAATLVAVRDATSGTRLAYQMNFGSPASASDIAWRLIVDAVSGSVIHLDQGGFDTRGTIFTQNTRLMANHTLVPSDVLRVLTDVVSCPAVDGQGADRRGTNRFFSTRHIRGTTDWVTASCRESPERLIDFNEVITFKDRRFGGVGPDLDLPALFSSADNRFSDRSAVEAQYWGERVVRFFKDQGLGIRKNLSQFGTLVPFRALMSLGWTGDTRELANAAFQPTEKIMQPTGYPGLDEVNGYAQFVTSPNPSLNIDSFTDPAIIAHELFHSFVWDYAYNAGSFADASQDFKEVNEGLSDCFAMIFTKKYLTEMNVLPVPPDPFIIGSGLFTSDLDKATSGWVNLVNPRLSEDGPRTTWAGNRSTQTTRIEHQNSTLLSGVCKLLITGGGIHDTEIAPITHVPGNLAGIALGYSSNGTNNEELGYVRLNELLLQTVQSALHPKMSWSDVIEAFATQAARLSEHWSTTEFDFDERVRTGFGAYGFGRSIEDENNEGDDIDGDDAKAAKNVIAIGKNWQRPIRGRACCQDEDFFVLNEKVRQGDTITVTATGFNNAGKFRIRIFEQRTAIGIGGLTACSFYGPPFSCEAAFQEYPPTEPNGSTPARLETVSDTGPLQTVTFVRTNPGMEDYYVAIAPAIGSNGGDYELSVTIARKSPAPY